MPPFRPVSILKHIARTELKRRSLDHSLPGLLVCPPMLAARRTHVHCCQLLDWRLRYLRRRSSILVMAWSEGVAFDFLETHPLSLFTVYTLGIFIHTRSLHVVGHEYRLADRVHFKLILHVPPRVRALHRLVLAATGSDVATHLYEHPRRWSSGVNQ